VLRFAQSAGIPYERRKHAARKSAALALSADDGLWAVISVINVQSLWVKAIYKERTNDKLML